MPKPMSKLTRSLKQIGEIQVTDWDFMTLLNKDVSELELTRSLKRLGNVQVMDWDFRSALPVINKLAHQEVDLVDIVKRAAHYKVMEWDFRTALASGDDPSPQEPAGASRVGPGPVEMQALTDRLRSFLQYVVVNLIDEPGHAQVRIQQIQSNVLRFKLVLVKRDVAMLIGREGHTASAIRGILKEVAGKQGAHVLLDILSHDDDLSERR